MRDGLWGPLRKKELSLRWNSTSWACARQQVTAKSGHGGHGPWTDVDVIEDGDDEDVEGRVAPADDDAGPIRAAGIGGPKDAHQAIMLHHDQRLEGAAPPQLFSR